MQDQSQETQPPAAETDDEATHAAIPQPTQPAHAQEQPGRDDSPDAEPGRAFGLVADVPVTLTANLGETSMLVAEILELHQGSVIELDRAPGDAIDILANGELIARGEVIVVDDRFGVRVTALMGESAPPPSGGPLHRPRRQERST